MLGAQNRGLNTEVWKVLHERAEEAGRIVTFSLDEPSVEVLKTLDFKAAFGFKRIIFKLKGGNPNLPESEDPQNKLLQTNVVAASTSAQNAVLNAPSTSGVKPPVKGTDKDKVTTVVSRISSGKVVKKGKRKTPATTNLNSGKK